jgi:nitrous oxidase accessory protein NosD
MTAGQERFHGIDINGSTAVTVAYNNISDSEHGVYLSNWEDNYRDIIISKNYIANNTSGIYIELQIDWTGQLLSSATIVGNTITHNTYAVYQHREEDVSCDPHRFYHNNFIDNTYNNITFFRGEATSHNWDDGYPSGGNYWSNYNGTDTRSGPNRDKNGWDGIGDTAYLMNENNVDHYPAMNMWPLAHLQVHTFAIEQGEIENVKVWVNATEPFQNSTAYFLLKFGTYPVKVESWFLRQDPQDPTKYYRYTFDHWENGSNQNPRTITLTTDEFLAAFYKVRVIYIEMPPSE